MENNCIVSFKSQISQEGEVESVEFHSEGSYIKKGNSQFLIFSEPVFESSNSVKSKLVIRNNEVQLMRQGDVYMRQRFLKEVLSEGTYETPQGKLPISVYTNELEIGNNNFEKAARENDSIISDAISDPIFEIWRNSFNTWAAGIGMPTPMPSTRTGRINSGSEQIKIGDK